MSEGGGEMRNPYGNIAAPMNGYIWDACNRAGVRVRSYGEFVERRPDPEAKKRHLPHRYFRQRWYFLLGGCFRCGGQFLLGLSGIRRRI